MKSRAALALTMLLAPAAAGAADPPQDENRDLELIPNTTPASPGDAAAGISNATGKIYLENAYTRSATRDDLLVPVPPPEPSSWEERALLDVREQWRLAPSLRLDLSDRLNLRDQEGIEFPSQESVTNDLREVFLAWQAASSTFIDAGRINLKSGVALGYNPTDYFKTRTVVEPLSVDPTVLREDRLGTLMLRAQQIWPRGALTAAYAPAVASVSPIYTSDDLPTFDPMFDRTNAKDRFLLKGSADLAAGLSPELLAYHEPGITRVGLNLAQPLTPAVVAYAEWSGGPRASLAADALRFGHESGQVPLLAPSPIPADANQLFRSELAAGLSYAFVETKLTVNLEFEYNQAAFASIDWSNWFRAGAGPSARSPTAALLWYLRDYGQDQEQQMSRSTVFLRADWVDALVPKLELTAIVDEDLVAPSALAQLTADYFVSDCFTVGALALAYLGPPRSDFGSLLQPRSVLLRFLYYF